MPVDAPSLPEARASNDGSDANCHGKVAIWRRQAAKIGVLTLVLLSLFATIGGAEFLAFAAFASLSISAVLAWIELHQARRDRSRTQSNLRSDERPLTKSAVHPKGHIYRWRPLIAVCATVAITAGAVQTWYTPGTAIAGGDLAPPNGTAWLGKLFAPWVWSGSDLGRPGSLETQLPWAGLLWLVHAGGGSSMLAQRLWYTILLSSAALAALWLLRILRISWTAAAVGSLLYVFNPFVVSEIGTNPVFLSAMALVVIVPAIILSVSSGRWKCRTGAVALVATVPLIGYSYENPPLVLAVLAAGIAAIIWSVVLAGRTTRRRVLAFMGVGAPLAALASLYWVIPSVAQIHFDAVRQISSLSSWSWTETRSTLANAFWLNTSWAWPLKEYTPYSSNYNALPLSALRYALPILGFASLTLRYNSSTRSLRALACIAVSATGSLFLIFFSTGTRFPGALLFDPLYHLPYGWLLQDPGRFLMLVGVGYIVMAAVTIDALIRGLDRTLNLERYSMRVNGVLGKAGVVVGTVGLVAIAPGYPLAFGAIAPGPRPDSIPSSHVRVPGYWTSLSSYLNSSESQSGSLLVLPPDPFYQVPYTWGYYGNDGFITDMIRRNVLDPASQGYGAASAELIRSVDQIATSLLDGADTAANRILAGLGTPDLLVRGDLVQHSPLASLDSSAALDAALNRDPMIHLVRRFGPLSLYRLNDSVKTLGGIHSGVPYATVQTASPNLLALAALKPGTALIQHKPISGVPDIVLVPNLASWNAQAGKLRLSLNLPSRRSYAVNLVGLTGRSARPISLVDGKATSIGSIQIKTVVTNGKTVVEMSQSLRSNELTDGTFASGQWGRVGNCNAVPGTHPTLAARIGSGPASSSGKALVLSANTDSACESRAIRWQGGPVLLSLKARTLSGHAPAVCMWEIGPDQCASLPALSESPRWQTYQEIVTPPRGTRGLSLFLYAESDAQSGPSTDAYASISIRSISTVARLAVVATDSSGYYGVPALTTVDSTFSSSWMVNAPREHVLVNGMINGWLGDTSRSLHPYYSARSTIVAGFIVAIGAGAIALLLGCGVIASNLRSRRHFVMDA